MKNCGSCRAWVPDAAASCPSCGTPLGPPKPPAEASAAPPPPPPPVPPPFSPAERVEAEDRVRTLGMIYVVLGAVGIAGLFLTFVLSLGLRASGIEIPPDADAETRRGLEWIRDRVRDLEDVHILVHAIRGMLQAAVFGLFVWSGLQLRQLRGRTLGLGMGIVALLLPIPCCCNCCTFPMCCLGPVLGIYALILLNQREVEAVF